MTRGSSLQRQKWIRRMPSSWDSSFSLSRADKRKFYVHYLLCGFICKRLRCPRPSNDFGHVCRIRKACQVGYARPTPIQMQVHMGIWCIWCMALESCREMESDLSFPQFLCRPFLSLVNAVISLQWPSWDLGAKFKRKRWKADVHGGTMSCSPVIPDIKYINT